ncbi:MAG: hypothetical protein QOG73_4791, partial [Acetobacteraceae bacterium]|nr:hypothetical protein [Acetobacteraceae bacterium]
MRTDTEVRQDEIGRKVSTDRT